MDGMSERDYAAHSGLSRGAIQKERKAGRLVLNHPDALNRIRADTALIPPSAVINLHRRMLGSDG